MWWADAYVALPGRTKAIFVHGCFWHGHACKVGKMPKTRTSYWGPKIVANRERDARKRRQLTASGWRSIVVWECETKDEAKLARKIARFLDY